MPEILPVSEPSLAQMAVATLAGPVTCDPLYAALAWNELVALGGEMRDQEQRAQNVLLHCVRRVLAIAGEQPEHRAKALAEYAAELGYTPGYLWQFARVGLILRADDQEKYPQLTVGQMYEAALRTGVPGEPTTAPERRARALAVMDAAADQGLSRRETARLATEVRDRAVRGALPSGDVEAVSGAVGAVPVPAPYFHQAAAVFRADLGRRLRAEEPGTWTLIEECATAAFLNLRGAWFVSPRES